MALVTGHTRIHCGQNNGATSLAVESENDTIQQVGSSSFDPVLRRLTVNLAGIPQVQSNWNSTTGVSEILNKPGTATTELQGLIQLATQAEVNTGTNTNKAVVPSTLQAKITANGVGIIASGSTNGYWVKYDGLIIRNSINSVNAEGSQY